MSKVAAESSRGCFFCAVDLHRRGKYLQRGGCLKRERNGEGCEWTEKAVPPIKGSHRVSWNP